MATTSTVIQVVEDKAAKFYEQRGYAPNVVRMSVSTYRFLRYEVREMMLEHYKTAKSMTAEDLFRALHDEQEHPVHAINTTLGMLRIVVVDEDNSLLEVTREWTPEEFRKHEAESLMGAN